MDATEALKKLAAEWKPKEQRKVVDGPDLSKWERLQKKAAANALDALPQKQKQQSLSMKKLGGIKKEAIADHMGQPNMLSADSGTTGAEMNMEMSLPPMSEPPMPMGGGGGFDQRGQTSRLAQDAGTIGSEMELATL